MVTGSSHSTSICPPHSPTRITKNSILKLAGAFHSPNTSRIRFWAFSYSMGEPCGRSNQLITYFIFSPAFFEALVDHNCQYQTYPPDVRLFRFRELLQRKRIAHLVEWLVASEALGLIHSGPVLLVGRENGVVPILVAQHLREVFAPTRAPSHCRVENEL